MNYSDHLIKMEQSSRSGKFLGPLVGFVLASLLPGFTLARLQGGSIKFQYDPVPAVQPPYINIYHTPRPVVTSSSTTKKYDEIVTTDYPTIHYPEYYLPSEKVKRYAPSRYQYQNNKRNRYSIRRRYPEYPVGYDDYDYPQRGGIRNRVRNPPNRRPPASFNYDYFDEENNYDYNNNNQNTNNRNRQKQQKRKNKPKNQKEPDYYSEENVDSDVEIVTKAAKPRQRETTTTEATTTVMTTMVTNGSTPAPNNTNNGYGANTGNENVSITYGPPAPIRPVYGVPGYEHQPSGTYSDWIPGQEFGSAYPSVTPVKPYPATSYGAPPPSGTYAAAPSPYHPGQRPQQPVPQTQGTGTGGTFQNYQLPFSSWYGGNPTHSDILKRVQDIIR